jgi:hypothetical protein
MFTALRIGAHSGNDVVLAGNDTIDVYGTVQTKSSREACETQWDLYAAPWGGDFD